jgi:glycosyltransferase involved in cell wall biosynthesis
MGNKLEFDIVIATRNRQSILKMCLPTLLLQSRLPQRLIVVDSSDDHASVQDLVRETLRGTNVTIDSRIIQSEPGLQYQRNIALRHVESPIVMFPDDDVLWFPGVAEAIMRVYELDRDGIVGSVAPVDSPAPPPGVFEGRDAPYRMAFRDRLAAESGRLIGPIVMRLFPDPLHPGHLSMTMWGRKSSPPWLPEEEAQLCGPVDGYRMSFRTAVIRRVGGFDVALGRYGLYEDLDASIGSLKENLNVCAKRARIYHHRDPGKRCSGAEWGMMAILNRTYIVCKHSLPGSVVRGYLVRYLYYQMFRYTLQVHTQYGRDRLRGAYYALSNARQLIDAPVGELAPRYLQIRRRLSEHDLS